MNMRSLAGTLLFFCWAALALTGCGNGPSPEVAPPPLLPAHDQWVSGEAIWYGQMFHGHRATSGETFDMRALTASHASLPLGSTVEVGNPANGRQVTVVINDRSHLEGGNALALSQAAAEALGVVAQRRFQVLYRWLP